MTKTLIIVESPNKTKKIEAFLGVAIALLPVLDTYATCQKEGLE